VSAVITLFRILKAVSIRLICRREQSVLFYNTSAFIIKQLLDEVFVISRIIEDEGGVISRSRGLRLITLTETYIILDITKPNLIIVLLYIERKKLKSCSCFFTDGKQHIAHKLDMITLRKSCTVVIHDMITHDLECP